MSAEAYIAVLGLVLSALWIGFQIGSSIDDRKHKK